MQDIEPFFKWRVLYTAETDPKSPFYKRQYNEFQYTQKVYNYYIHPQWDHFGAATLYCKLLFVDYTEGSAVLEFIGEWNDCLYNDIMFLKQNVLDPLLAHGIHKFVFVVENVLSFHGGDDDYYVALAEECAEYGGWVAVINALPHVEEEMLLTKLQYQIFFGEDFEEMPWRTMLPQHFVGLAEQKVFGGKRQRKLT